MTVRDLYRDLYRLLDEGKEVRILTPGGDRVPIRSVGVTDDYALVVQEREDR